MDGVQRVGELDQSAAKPRIEVCSTTNLGEGVGETRNGGNPFKMVVDCDIVYKQSQIVQELLLADSCITEQQRPFPVMRLMSEINSLRKGLQ